MDVVELGVAVVGTVVGTGIGALLLGAAAASRWLARVGREAGEDLVAPQGSGFGYATARARARQQEDAEVVQLHEHRRPAGRHAA